ncbi:MAG: hypothetical protein ABI639_07775 [Thermoanaerobaculia bacterium]
MAVSPASFRSEPGFSGRPRRRWPDALFASLLAAMALLIAVSNWSALGDDLPLRFVDSTWYEADSPGYFEMMTNRLSDHDDTRTHPLFSLLTWPVVRGVEAVTGCPPAVAAAVYLSGIAVLWTLLLYAVLRRLECRAPEAFLFALLALSSATARCWFAVPETYMMGGLSILIALFIALAKNPGEVALTLGSAASLAVAVPNWMAGLAGSILRLDWKRALRSSAVALGLVCGLWGVEKLIFPSAVFFFGHWQEAAWVFNPRALGPFAVVRAFFLHSMVLPVFASEDRYIWSNLTITIQGSPTGTGGPFATTSVAIWIALLGIGLYALVRGAVPPRSRLLIAGLVAGQLALHLLFGDETFLYAPHYFALLIIVAALGLRTRFRPAVWILAGALTVSAGIHNQIARADALHALHQYVARPGKFHSLGIRPSWARPRRHHADAGAPRPTSAAHPSHAEPPLPRHRPPELLQNDE